MLLGGIFRLIIDNDKFDCMLYNYNTEPDNKKTIELLNNIRNNYNQCIEKNDNTIQFCRYMQGTQCYILELDDPTLLHILSYLGPKDIFITTRAVCKHFLALCGDKYIIEGLKNRSYKYTNCTPIVYKNLSDLKSKLQNIYFNTFI